jgi:putative endonuclease
VSSQPYWVYILECRNNNLYTGMAVDVQARFEKHCRGKGARYTRMNQPIRILAARRCHGRGDAARLEAAIKRWPRPTKLIWVAQNPWLEAESAEGRSAPD